MNTSQKTIKRAVRHNRIRAKVKGTEERPRLSIFRSNVFIYAQIINDDTATTLASATSRGLKKKGVEAASLVGTAIATAAKAKGVSKVVFDRGGFIYTGQVKVLAESARAAGLEF
jgi:large subunit ribosomal protein L18